MHRMGPMRFLLVLVAIMAACSDSQTDPLDGVYVVDWGLAPKPLLGCDELALDRGVIAWSGDSCDEPSLDGGPANESGCNLYRGDGYLWWVCPNGDGRVVGELIAGGQVVADFSASVR